MTLQDCINVNVLNREYMEEIRDQGPLKNVFLPVKTVIELLNNNRLIEFNVPHQKDQLYMLIRQYNISVGKLKKSNLRQADIAEKRLSENLYARYVAEEALEAIDNPIDTPITREERVQEQAALDEIKMKRARDNRKKHEIKRVQKTDIFKKSELKEESNNILYDVFDSMDLS